jgi:hypothetical protein
MQFIPPVRPPISSSKKFIPEEDLKQVMYATRHVCVYMLCRDCVLCGTHEPLQCVQGHEGLYAYRLIHVYVYIYMHMLVLVYMCDVSIASRSL